jgi:phage terminase small subunit
MYSNTKPAAIIKFEGNPGHKTKKQIAEREKALKVSLSVPVCPKGLATTALWEWKRIVPLLREAGVLSKMDKAALAVYCVAYSDWLTAVRTATPSKPNINEKYKTAMIMHKFLSEFGLSPVARMRIHETGKDKETKNDFD